MNTKAVTNVYDASVQATPSFMHPGETCSKRRMRERDYYRALKSRKRMRGGRGAGEEEDKKDEDEAEGNTSLVSI